MRKIDVKDIINAVKEMCIESNYNLNPDIKNALMKGMDQEESPIGRYILKDILKNADIATNNRMPMCQDTGMVVVFVEIGQEVFIDGNIKEAINEGVRQGYRDGFLRKSVVSDPIIRENTFDNTPAIIHYDFVKGDKLKIAISPKGFGSENMSKLKMLKPSDGIEGVKKFILETVSQAGPNPCPPIVVGVGIGGTVDKVTEIAKKALMRPITTYNEVEYVKEFEKEMLKEINKLGIGPQGLGGTVTALGINVEVYPTHIAGLPVAVNISCHATRHLEMIL